MPLSEDQLISQYAPLVRRQALGLIGRLPANVELDDLMQAGMMGLLDAVRRYRQQADAQFETYAITRIRGAMLDELRSQDWLPRSVRSKSRAVEAAVQSLHHQLMRAPTETEIAAEMGLELAEYQALLDDARGMQVLMVEDLALHRDDPGSGGALLDSIAGDAGANPLDWLMRDGLRAVLIQAIENLPAREQLLLSLQFQEDLNQKEIAAVLGVTEGRVSQLRSQAVARIRAWLASHAWAPDAGETDYENLF
ncbi:RNA polymerase sigma factor FliA [Castellaniella hirudinis]|uniref:RNA polymerase sigma factor FliA n=1 Tax=Castellaniella hirudinis TaxID=1144617 RepID=UPI0039C1471A